MSSKMAGLLIAQHFCQFWEARFEGESAVDQLPEECDERSIHKRDKDCPGTKSMKPACQGKRQYGRKKQHNKIIDKLNPVEIQHEAVRYFADKKLIDGNRQ